MIAHVPATSRAVTNASVTPLVVARAALWLVCAMAIARSTPVYAHLALVARALRSALGYATAAPTPLTMRDMLGGALATLAATVLTLASVEVRARPDASSRNSDCFALAAAAFAALGLFETFAIGSTAFAWSLAALVLVLTDDPTPRRTLAALGIVGVWCASGIDGLYGVVLLGISLASTFAERRDRTRIAYALGAFVAAIVVAALAFAVEGRSFRAVGATLADPSAGGTLAVLPAEVAPFGYSIGFALAILGLVTIGMRPPRVRDTVLVMASVLLALRDGAAVPLVGIVVAPLLARGLRELVTRGFGREVRAFAAVPWRWLPTVAIAFAALVSTALAGATHTIASTDAAAYVRAIDALASDGKTHLIFCGRPTWCTYATASGGARVRAFVDDRTARYPAAILREQHDIARARPTWQHDLATAGITDVLAGRTTALATLLRGTAGWHLRETDGPIVLFTRTSR